MRALFAEQTARMGCARDCSREAISEIKRRTCPIENSTQDKSNLSTSRSRLINLEQKFEITWN